jgi:hypothetical protein
MYQKSESYVKNRVYIPCPPPPPTEPGLQDFCCQSRETAEGAGEVTCMTARRATESRKLFLARGTRQK